MDLKEVFTKFKDEYLEFERVENKLSECMDIHAYLLLQPFLGWGNRIVGGAEHDEIWLNVDTEKFAKVATEEMVCELSRCGLRYDANADAMCMFV